MKININVELDTDSVEDKQKIQEFYELLEQLKELLEESKDGR